MECSCTVCGRSLPAWHERAPSSVDFCSLECATLSGATLQQVAEFKHLNTAASTTAPIPKT